MADQWKIVHCLSNSTIFNDLERPHTPISRSGHSLTLSISWELVEAPDVGACC